MLPILEPAAFQFQHGIEKLTLVGIEPTIFRLRTSLRNIEGGRVIHCATGSQYNTVLLCLSSILEA